MKTKTIIVNGVIQGEEEVRYDALGRELRFGDLCIRMYGDRYGIYVYLKPVSTNFACRAMDIYDINPRRWDNETEPRKVEVTSKKSSIIMNSKSLLRVGSIDWVNKSVDPDMSLSVAVFNKFTCGINNYSFDAIFGDDKEV